ncbi:hypothetical protein EV421DRAFT_1946559 [Armillaria borealis]|uniref:Band 7 domain-containing protein n=1 Tax=Armillaria borealis TaxID=47425 RepID=A0AA39JIU5_9AGAR|nr:hypothetical protein EV421DRAFT_1946559 [Armillaria borealis]
MNPSRTSLRSATRFASQRQSPSSLAAPRRNIFTIIQQGHEGWRLSFGRNPVQLNPGIRLNLPVYHTIQKVDLRESAISIPNLPGYTLDNVPVTCSGSLFYRIVDGYKACFEISDVQNNIRNAGTSAMRAVLGTFSYDQVIGDRNGLNAKLNSVIGNSIRNWGVEGTRFEIQSFQPANREVERQLELQMEAERNRRKQLLDTQAQVNVAEGHKQRVILESEGHLRAKANEAEASYKTVVREAEARQQQAIMEASALAMQYISGQDNVKPEERLRALETLVELRRLEQLRAIAASKSNSTYFFGDKSALGRSSADAYNIDYAEHIKNGVEKTRREAGAVMTA